MFGAARRVPLKPAALALSACNAVAEPCTERGRRGTQTCLASAYTRVHACGRDLDRDRKYASLTDCLDAHAHLDVRPLPSSNN